jgi:hypothetical protein
MIDEKASLANESHDWNAPWLGKVSSQHIATLNRPTFSISNESSVKIRKFSFKEVQMEAASKFDPNLYYGKDTPSMTDYGGTNDIWIKVVAGICTFVFLLTALCCVYCCCGHWITKKCCPSPGGGTATPPAESVEMQSRRRPVREESEFDNESEHRRSTRRARRVTDRYLEENQQGVPTATPTRDQERQPQQSDYRTVYVRPTVSTDAAVVESHLRTHLREAGEQIDPPHQERPPPNVTMTSEMDENKPSSKHTESDPSKGKKRAARTNISKKHYSVATTVGSLMVMAPIPTTAFTKNHPLNQPSPLPDRTMFLFVLNLCGLVIALLVIVKHGYQLALNARRIRYKASTFLRRVFHINVKTSAKIYLEISNYRDCAYLPLVELAIPPKDLFYIKPFLEEPKCTLHLSWCRSYMRVRWRSSGIVVKSPQHADLYIRLPKSILVPGASKYILMDILNGPYIITLIMRHANTFCERLPVLGDDHPTTATPTMLATDPVGPKQEYLALTDADHQLKQYVMNLSKTSGRSGLRVDVKKRDPDPI